MAYDQNPAGRNPMDARGLIVTGTHAGCGKSVACAGLAGVLNELGFHTQAMKPLAFLPEISMRKGYEQAFFDRVVPPLQMVDLLTADAPRAVTPVEYQRLVEICRKRVYPYLLETPGNAATPIRLGSGELLDAADLASMLGLPILIVTSKQRDLIGSLAPVLAYLEKRQANVMGWLCVETTPPKTMPIETSERDQECLALRSRHQATYLGEIAYSPTISVETLQVGNLINATEMGVDLLPIQQALDLVVPV
jgi:dethiobiotin synthetase